MVVALAVTLLLTASLVDIRAMRQAPGPTLLVPPTWPVEPPEEFVSGGLALPPPFMATKRWEGRFSSLSSYAAQAPDGRWKHLILIESGWPLRALRGWQWHDASPTDPTSRATTHWAYLINAPRPGTADAFRPHFLPLQPTWGFAVNLALLLGVLMLPWGLVALIRHMRYRPGTCRRCRHHLLPGQPRCPECGTPCAETAQSS